MLFSLRRCMICSALYIDEKGSWLVLICLESIVSTSITCCNSLADFFFCQYVLKAPGISERYLCLVGLIVVVSNIKRIFLNPQFVAKVKLTLLLTPKAKTDSFGHLKLDGCVSSRSFHFPSHMVFAFEG